MSGFLSSRFDKALEMSCASDEKKLGYMLGESDDQPPWALTSTPPPTPPTPPPNTFRYHPGFSQSDYFQVLFTTLDENNYYDWDSVLPSVEEWCSQAAQDGLEYVEITLEGLGNMAWKEEKTHG